MIEFDVSANLSHTDVRDVMNSNRMNSMSRLMERLSHTTNVNAFVLFFAVRICRVRTLKEREYQLPVATKKFLTSGTSTSSSLKVPTDSL